MLFIQERKLTFKNGSTDQLNIVIPRLCPSQNLVKKRFMRHFGAPKSLVTFHCTKTRTPSCGHSPDWAVGDAQCTHLLPRISFIQLPQWQCQAELLGHPVKGTRLWIIGSKGVCNISHGSYHDVESSVLYYMFFDKRLASSNR